MNIKTIRRAIKVQLFVLTVLALPVFPARAWNSVGHRTVAEIAWRQMDQNERRAISDLLKQHPHYKQLLAVDVPNGVKTDEWVFLSAAVWPDWVRPARKGQPDKPDSITKYGLHPHAVGYPFLRAGETNRALLENFYIAVPDAEMVLSNSIATLKNPKASAQDRAVSLCWTLHLFGDLHQPLHTANLVTKEKPRGEGLGGNFIALDAHGKQINLHSFWDQLPGVDPSYKAVATLANELIAAPELKPAAMKEYQENKTIHLWVQEGFRLATNFAYAEDRVQFAREDGLRSGTIPESAIPNLKAGYITEAQKIAHRRLMLAGQRVADVLKKIW